MSQIDYEKLNDFRYEKYSVLSKYINKIKKDLVGKKIEKIMRLGVIFNEEYSADAYLELDEPIDIQIGKDIHLNIDFACDSNAIVGINLFDYTETSYADGLSWRNLNSIYKDHIVNEVIKDLVLTKVDLSSYTCEEYAKKLEDDFCAIKIVLENGYALEITSWEDFMTLNEYKVQA